jgi:hypothetical protein
VELISTPQAEARAKLVTSHGKKRPSQSGAKEKRRKRRRPAASVDDPATALGAVKEQHSVTAEEEEEEEDRSDPHTPSLSTRTQRRESALQAEQLARMQAMVDDAYGPTVLPCDYSAAHPFRRVVASRGGGLFVTKADASESLPSRCRVA